MKTLQTLLILLLLNMLPSYNAFAYEIREVTPNAFKDTVIKNNKIKLVYIFTSWCSVCKRSLPQVINLFHAYDKEQVDIIMLSLDENEEILKKTFRPFEGENFIIYRINQSNPKAVLKALLDIGVAYKGSIPHSALIDAEGVVMANGNYQIPSLKKGIEYLIKKK